MTRPGWNRRCGRCWPSTRRCGSPSPTPSPPSRAPTPTGPATRSPSRPPRRWSPAPRIVTGAADLAGDIGRAVLANLPGRAGPALRPPGQIPAQPLEQAPARQTPNLPADHQDHHCDQPGPPAGGDTPPTRCLDTGAWPFNSPALRLARHLSTTNRGCAPGRSGAYPDRTLTASLDQLSDAPRTESYFRAGQDTSTSSRRCGKSSVTRPRRSPNASMTR